MIQVSVDRIISSEDLPDRLREVLDTTVSDHFWVITDSGKPRAAVVDLEYLNGLVRKAWFDSLSAYTHSVFRNYLIRKGLNPDEMTEEEIEKIIHG